MAQFADWEIVPAVAAGLESLGWRADEPEVRDVVPPVLRGGNVVAILPPAPAWAGPVVAGLLGQPKTEKGGVLILATAAQLGEWAVTVGAILERSPLQVDVAREPGKGPAVSCDVLIASPESALDRHARSALHPESFRAILFAWPEQWHADDAVTALLQDIPKDAQRIVLTTQPDQLDGPGGLVERYARRALVLAAPASEPGTNAPRATSVRTAATSWAGRPAVVAAVLDALDQPRTTIWTADQRDHQLIRRALGSLRTGLTLESRAIPTAGAVVCYDPPSAAQLAQLSAVGEVVLLVPPACEPYAARIAPTRRPMQLNAPATATMTRDAALRQEIGQTIAQQDSAAALYALAPMFEAHDPQVVAAALFALWQGRSASPSLTRPAVSPSRALAPDHAPGGERNGLAASPVKAGGSPAMGKIWIGAGKQDDATVADFVAVLVREVGVERSHIGRIELRDTFALVEVPAADAEAIALRLSGITIRRRKLTARVDQGRGGGTARPKR